MTEPQSRFCFTSFVMFVTTLFEQILKRITDDANIIRASNVGIYQMKRINVPVQFVAPFLPCGVSTGIFFGGALSTPNFALRACSTAFLKRLFALDGHQARLPTRLMASRIANGQKAARTTIGPVKSTNAGAAAARGGDSGPLGGDTTEP